MGVINNARYARSTRLHVGSIELQPVFFILGILLTILGIAMLGPAILDIALNERDWREFLLSSGITVFAGLMLVASNHRRSSQLNLRQGFLLTALSWLTLSFFGGLPFVFANDNVGMTDAIFESVSGLTATGATILTHLEHQPPGLLLWRSLLHWVGGIGIIGMATTLLPALRVGGMQLFRVENSDTSEHGMTRFAGLGAAILVVYLTMTFVMIGGLLFAGLPTLEAVCLAMSAVSTGGFANSDSSVAALPPMALWFLIGGMVLGALPFLLYVRAIRGRPEALYRDPQVRGFLAILVVFSLVISVYHWMKSDVGFLQAITTGTFSVTSVITTTGLVYEDYSAWGSFALLFFFMLLFFGGCTGSTTGGIKTFRFQVAFIVLSSHIRRRYLPHAVVMPTYGGRTIDDDIAVSVCLFFFAQAVTIWFFALILGLLGLDWVSAISGSVATVCNVGPGVGAIIGPVGNYSSLSPEAKWVFSAGMLMGRLELFTMMVLLDYRFWRD
ncbi:TrkH family potassium uptake protein [Phaeovibrio sulfidiphilus]|uniref:Trk system potassium uptake protein n=1 Tax=Phaeovibrio sulfidiphilus TaxID=1220600 RepID=A0A8J6YI33_9PROT|nr:TrkH family potassium uptake protein [Phaeovibrio sulfidiphilus]MBE1236636.1 TrkH family potassium uptake protein [Phaeovibrio sulfidiphilus]